MTSYFIPFPAKYPGECTECGEWWKKGTRIVRTDDGGYVHEKCPEELELESGKPAGYLEPKTSIEDMGF